MNKAKILLLSVKKRGLAETFKLMISTVVDYFFDIKYGTDTFSWVEIDDLGIDDFKKSRTSRYAPTPVSSLRKVFRELKIPPGKVLVDLGCGKGRVLLVASEFEFKEVRGIEFSSTLCDIAMNNYFAYKNKRQTKTKLSVIEMDVLDYKLGDDEDVFYIFDSFDADVLRQVLQNIITSVSRRKREIWIIYVNPVHREVLEENKEFKELKKFNLGGHDCVVYTNRDIL